MGSAKKLIEAQIAKQTKLHLLKQKETNAAKPAQASMPSRAETPKAAAPFELPKTTAQVELPKAAAHAEQMIKASENIQQQQQKIELEIEKVKAEPVVRKEDESTRVFNLRQLDMTSKIKDLELKKVKAENELRKLMQMKNTKLHEDLKKISENMVEDLKKLAPLESGINSILTLKSEMQTLLEASLEEKKVNLKTMEDQTKEIHAIGDLIRNTFSILDNNYKQMNLDLERLMMDRLDLVRKNSQLQEEIMAKEDSLKILHQKHAEYNDLEKNIQFLREEKIKLEKVSEDFQKITDKSLALKKEIEQTKERREEIVQNTSRMEVVYQQLEEQVKAKREDIVGLEKQYFDCKKRLEDIRDEEIHLMKQYQAEMSNLNKVKSECSHLESLRSSAEEIYEKTEKFYAEKKEFLNKEMIALENENKIKTSHLESTFELKKRQWEEEFKSFCNSRHEDFKKELENVEKEDLVKIKERKSDFLKDIVGILNHNLSKQDFVSTAQREEELKKEAEKIFDQLFGKTSRWKIW